MVAKRGTQSGIPWELAPSLVRLIDQVDALWPRRDRSSDGSIGDVAHQSRRSDHNPDDTRPVAVVRALDIDEGIPAGEEEFDRLVVDAIAASRDPRLAYIIRNGRILSSYRSVGGSWTAPRAAWEWGAYTGPNAHHQHAHFSILRTRAAADDRTPWQIGPPMAEHTHKPMPDELPRGWADAAWSAWVARSGTDAATRGHTFYREDLGWVYDRIIRPLEAELTRQAGEIAALRRELADGGGSSADRVARDRISELADHLRAAPDL